MKPYCFFIGTSWLDRAVDNHFKALGHELVERGHRIVFLINGQRVEDEDQQGNPAIYTWPSKRPENMEDFTFLRQLIRRYQPDCLIANFSSVNVMMIVGWLTGVPVRVTWYHTLTSQIDLDSDLSDRKKQILRLRKRMVYGLATHLVAVSEAAAVDLQRVFAVPGQKCSVWPILLSDPAIENLPAPLRRPNVVACVGRLNRTKGQDVLIRALPTLIEQLPQIEVEFIGEGPERDRYQALADELEVGANCRFIGLKPHDEVMHHMATSMLVVVPSRIDALGLVNIEALAVGTPVVGSSVGGIVEVISDQVNGYLVPPDDPIDLSEKILELLKNPRKWHQFSQEARQTFLTHFELRNNVIGQANWYENLVTTASN